MSVNIWFCNVELFFVFEGRGAEIESGMGIIQGEDKK